MNTSMRVRIMNISTFASAAMLAASVGLSASAQAQTAQLTPAPQRISDEAIQADHQVYEALQRRIKALNDGGRRVADYHLTKAQCWLDVSFHEYTRNDRSLFPQAALGEAEKLIAAMEKKLSPLPMETPLVNDAARLRPDLWAATAALKSGSGFQCAEQKIACSEVELVHAGNEFNQQQWRHAKPYVQIAEDLVAQAQTLAASCHPPIASVAQPPAPLPTPGIEWVAHVVFAFDRSGEADVHPASLGPLHQLAEDIAKGRIAVDSVRLIGHADRLNGTGHADYNQALSERRVATVRAMLTHWGVNAQSIQTEARGDSQQIEACAGNLGGTLPLQECLLPNRRVEVLVRGHRAD
jgi:outer membrane protein OmpA-like peptidoglycan-associated protein